MVVYNPSGWTRTETVAFAVPRIDIVVVDATGAPLPAQVDLVPSIETGAIINRLTVRVVVPPLGYTVLVVKVESASTPARVAQSTVTTYAVGQGDRIQDQTGAAQSGRKRTRARIHTAEVASGVCVCVCVCLCSELYTVHSATGPAGHAWVIDLEWKPSSCTTHAHTQSAQVLPIRLTIRGVLYRCEVPR